MHSCSCYIKKNCCCGDFSAISWILVFGDILQIFIQTAYQMQPSLSINSNITFAFKQASYEELGACEMDEMPGLAIHTLALC